MLTNPHWRNDPQITKAFANSPPFRPMAQGSGVVLLRQALMKFDFERTLDAENFYGEQTRYQVEDFQRLYGLTPDGVAGKNTLQTLDDLLNGRRTKKTRNLILPTGASVCGRQFALKYLQETRNWISSAIRICETAESLIGPRMIGLRSPDELLAGEAFLFHFRVALDNLALQQMKLWKYQGNLFLINDENEKRFTISKVRNVFLTMHGKLESAEAIFKDDPTTTDIAYTPNNIVFFSTRVFKERGAAAPDGMDPRSASWVTIHELIHAILGESAYHKYQAVTAIPTENPYSHKVEYYSKDWRSCRKNPDCYAHFAYQSHFRRPVLGPYA